MPSGIDELFEALISRDGTDLHLGVGLPPLARIDGTLAPLRPAPVEAPEMDELLDGLLDEDQRRRYTTDLGVDLSVRYAEPVRGAVRARFRGSLFHDAAGRAAVFRRVPPSAPSLDELGGPAALRRLAERRAGLCLVTGPSRSGKTTTLAAMVRHINELRACHVLTIEAPIELVHDPVRAQITQRQIGDHAPSFAAALTAARLDDADVVVIGELRDAEAIRLALEIAGSGALVLAAMQGSSATSTIDRILHAFCADEQPHVSGLLAECLLGIVTQHLLPATDGARRVAAHEILLGSPAVSAVVREGRTYQIPALLHGGQAAGMLPLDVALERLVAAGSVDRDVALDRATDREALARALDTPPG